MCCGDDRGAGPPPAVIEMWPATGACRPIAAGTGATSGSRCSAGPGSRRSATSSRRTARPATGRRPCARWSAPTARGIVVVRVLEGGRVHCGPPRPVVAGVPMPLDVVVDSAVDREVAVVVAGEAFTVAAGGAGVATVDVDGPPARDRRRRAGVARRRRRSDGRRRAAAARGPLRALVGHRRHGRRVVPRRRAAQVGRPRAAVFHADDVTLTVPSTPLTVTCTRGLEFERRRAEVTAGETLSRSNRRGASTRRRTAGTAAPARPHELQRRPRVHPGRRGPDAARRGPGPGQRGGGQPRRPRWSTTGSCWRSSRAWTCRGRSGDIVARAGVEYRNDLLGHVHALGPTRRRAATTRATSAPTTRGLAAEPGGVRRAAGAVGDGRLPAPVSPRSARTAPPTRSSPTRARSKPVSSWSTPRSGSSISLDLLSRFDDEAAVYLYHRLLSCGLRLTATAGTDVFLSFSHGPGVASNPPGWARVYAHLGDAPLSVEAFKQAIRDGAHRRHERPVADVRRRGPRPRRGDRRRGGRPAHVDRAR